jgi:hypothetical protein
VGCKFEIDIFYMNWSSSSILYRPKLLLDKNNSFISDFYFLQSSSSGNNASNASSSSGGDGTETINSGAMIFSVPYESHIIIRHTLYQMSCHREASNQCDELLPEKATGIRRDRLIITSSKTYTWCNKRSNGSLYCTKTNDARELNCFFKIILIYP